MSNDANRMSSKVKGQTKQITKVIRSKQEKSQVKKILVFIKKSVEFAQNVHLYLNVYDAGAGKNSSPNCDIITGVWNKRQLVPQKGK